MVLEVYGWNSDGGQVLLAVVVGVVGMVVVVVGYGKPNG